MNSVRTLLERQREAERQFVARARAQKGEPKGWPAALIMFHIARWRERLRTAFDDVHAGRPYTPPPSNIDEFNDAELPRGAGLPLDATAASADAELASLIELVEVIGERPFAWAVTKTSTEALLRNSYIHPRIHIFQYLSENGGQPAAHELFEEAARDLRDMSAPPFILGAAVFNLAGVRVEQGQHDEALELLAEGLSMRPDLTPMAANHPDFAPLHGLERFNSIIGA